MLKKGVAAWNKWRDENANIRPGLSGADLGLANLREANLSGGRGRPLRGWPRPRPG
jgi:hypothetical protein